MHIRQYKTTFIAKAIAAVGWVLTIGLIICGSLFVVIEDMELAAIPVALVCILSGAGIFIGLQLLATAVDDRLTARRKAPEKSAVPAAKPSAGSFRAAGKLYCSISELQAIPTAQSFVSLDVHGRPVAHCAERFPCFDSFDYLYEDRYFHWYYIWYNGSWTEIYKSDDSSEIRIREALTTEWALAAWHGPKDSGKAALLYVRNNCR